MFKVSGILRKPYFKYILDLGINSAILSEIYAIETLFLPFEVKVIVSVYYCFIEVFFKDWEVLFTVNSYIIQVIFSHIKSIKNTALFTI